MDAVPSSGRRGLPRSSPLRLAILEARFAALAVAAMACGDRSPLGVFPDASFAPDVSLETSAACSSLTGGSCEPVATCGDAGAACLACVSSSVCECTGFPYPSSCETGSAPCEGQLPQVEACQAAAVGLVKCAASCGATCDEAYSTTHPGSILPLGLTIDLYRCAVCGSCAAACGGSRLFGDWCP